jgi:ferredoxin-NADP reductase
MHSPTIATFWFRSPDPLAIKPGQAAILSFAALLGMPAYSHMAPSNPKSINDDRIRTWTVSSSSTYDFSITMREIPRGVITGAVFNLARSIGKSRPDLLPDTSELEIRLGFIGISGSFSLPPPVKDVETKLLWIAGGIGLTPFLAMLNALKDDPRGSRWDIHMILSTREPEVLLPLLMDAANIPPDRVTFTLDLFSTEKTSEFSEPQGVRVHRGRVDSKFWETIDTERKVYLCGPKPFEQTVLEGLASRGVSADEIMIEGFAY